MRAEPRVEIERAGGQILAARDDHRPHFVLAPRHRFLKHRHERRRHECGLRAAVREHERVVGGGQQRVDGDRNHTCVERAEERDWPVAGVVHQQQHALLAANAQREQCGSAASRAHGQFAVGKLTRVVEVRDLAGARGVEVDQMAGEVESLWGRQRPGCSGVGHRGPPEPRGGTSERRRRRRSRPRERSSSGPRHGPSACPRRRVRPRSASTVDRNRY